MISLRTTMSVLRPFVAAMFGFDAPPDENPVPKDAPKGADPVTGSGPVGSAPTMRGTSQAYAAMDFAIKDGVAIKGRGGTVLPESDGRFFVWVRTVAPWTMPKLDPQIIRDVEMEEYLQAQRQLRGERWEFVGPKHLLKVEEYGLTINELVERYPAPDVPVE